MFCISGWNKSICILNKVFLFGMFLKLFFLLFIVVVVVFVLCIIFYLGSYVIVVYVVFMFYVWRKLKSGKNVFVY